MNVEFNFSMGERVTILGCGLFGVVEGLWLGKSGKQHVSVRYFDTTGKACDIWFTDDELAAGEVKPAE